MLKVFSVFSGIGAFEYAIHEVFDEYKVNGFSEIDKFAKMVYKYNFSQAVDYGNILNIDINNLDDFDILVGGPPCQPYSTAGKRLGRFDKRGEPLISKYLEILKIKKPKFFIFENVKGLTDNKFKDFFNEILSEFQLLGYNTEYTILNTAEYGIPQRRKRIFIVGYLNQISNINLGILNIDKEECKNKFKDILLPLNKIDDKYFYTKTAYDFMISDANFKDEIKNRFALGNYFDTDHILSPTLTANLKNGYPTNFVIDRRGKNTNYCQYGFNSCQFVGQPDMCDICDGGDNYQEMYPIKTQFPIFRKIHPVECERLQGFPDNFTKYGINEKGNKIEISDTQRWKQLGNSISTNVLVKILYNIKKYI